MSRIPLCVVAFAILCLPATALAAPAPSQASIAAAIVVTFAPVGQVDQALCVADHESDGTPHHFTAGAVSHDQWGLFQLARTVWDAAVNRAALSITGFVNWARILDPLENARAALAIYKHSGWLPAWRADARVCGLS